jgi:hypothetical protein
MEYNLDHDLERHNIFLNNNKRTEPLRSTAATSPGTAATPVATALLPIGGIAYHLPHSPPKQCWLPLWSLPLSLLLHQSHHRA